MKTRLFIRMPVDGSHSATWLRRGPSNAMIGGLQLGSLAEAADLARDCEVIVLVPTSGCLLVEAKVPSRQRERIRRALPFLLEEQLASDLDELHFAVGRTDAAGNTPALVGAVTMIAECLEQLDRAGIRPDLVTADLFGLPHEPPGSWTVLVEAPYAWVRTAAHGGFAVDADNLGLALQQALQQAGTEAPAALRVFSREPLALDVGAIPVEQAALGQPLLAFLSEHFTGEQAINLLQGRFSRREQLGQIWRPWIPTAAIAAIVASLSLGTLISDYVHYRSEQGRLKAEIERLYREAFPEARRIVNPRAQMESDLQALRAGGGTPTLGFLPLLGKAGPLFAKMTDLELQRMSFRDGRLSLNLTVASLQTLDALKQELVQEAGVGVEIQSATARENSVEAVMLLAPL